MASKEGLGLAVKASRGVTGRLDLFLLPANHTHKKFCFVKVQDSNPNACIQPGHLEKGVSS